MTEACLMLTIFKIEVSGNLIPIRGLIDFLDVLIKFV